MKKVLLIGGEGYIGNIVSQRLLQEKYFVISYDNLIYRNQQCVLHKMSNSNYKFIYGDILDSKLIKKTLTDIDYVVLLAGLVGDPITKKYPKESKLINDIGIKNVIDICSESDVEKLIFISTCSNYGLIKGNQLADENFELNPLSLYANSKVNAENYILSLKGKTKMSATILRFATAFGLSPRMRFDLTISEFTRELSIQNNLLVYDADTWRPYCHVGDFARLIQKVLEAKEDKVSFEVFNAGGDINNATKQMIVDEILKKVPFGKVDYKKHGTDPRNYRVDFSKVRSVLDFEPKYTIKNGIDELVIALKNHIFEFVESDKLLFGNYKINYKGNL